MVALMMNLHAEGAPLARPAPVRWSLFVGVPAALGLWLAPTPAYFAVAWGLLFAWACARAAAHGERARVPLQPAAAGLLTTALVVWKSPPVVVAALGAAVATAAVPFHLWLEDLRRKLSRQEFQLVLLAQPGVAWLHRSVESNPALFDAGVGRFLLPLFVASALVQSGLGLVRRDATRALIALTLSQSSLLAAGAFAGGIGWSATRMMLCGTAAGSLVLLSLAGELRDTFGVSELAGDNGLADVAPDLHRLFVAVGWLFVGIPGGLAFFAEDVLFHALLETSLLGTAGFVLATGLNAIAFHRIYTGLFCGTPRAGLAATKPGPDTRRRHVRVLTLVALLLVLGGVAPAIFS